VDSSAFEGAADRYQGSGPCLRLVTSREQLERFYQDLRAEYVAFRQRHGIDAHNREEAGPDYREPWF
jgi:hypothetical protein